MYTGQQVNELDCFLAREPWSVAWAKADAESFLERLGKKITDEMEFILVNEDLGYRKTEKRLFGNLVELWPVLESATLNGMSVFFRLNNYIEGRKLSRKNLKSICALVVEGRTTISPLLEVQPNLMVEAGNEICAYFLLNEEESLKIKEAESLSLEISRMIGTYQHASNPNQIFRLVGTLAWKRNNPSYVQDTKGWPNRFFTFAEIRELFQVSDLQGIKYV